MNASADCIDNTRMAGNSYDPDVSRISSVNRTPETLKSPWCISSIVRLYLVENVPYRNWVMSDDLPTFAAPSTTILCLTALLAILPLLETGSSALSVLLTII